MQYFLLQQQKKYLNMVKPGDYSLLLSGIDHSKISTEDLKGFFEKEGIHNIEILYTHKIGRFLEAERQKALLKTQLEYVQSKGVESKELEMYKNNIRVVE